jgi:hypothetical protein
VLGCFQIGFCLPGLFRLFCVFTFLRRGVPCAGELRRTTRFAAGWALYTGRGIDDWLTAGKGKLDTNRDPVVK